eukprot:1468521-Pyramimonas_sp.AAC.1
METRNANAFNKQKSTTETTRTKFLSSKTTRPTTKTKTKTSELRRLVFTHCGRNEIFRWTRSQLERYLICRQLINVDDTTLRFDGGLPAPEDGDEEDKANDGDDKHVQVQVNPRTCARTFTLQPPQNFRSSSRSSILTDRAHDVLVVEHLKSTSSVVFDQISTGLTDLSTELQNSRDVLADVSHENTTITTHLAQPHLTNRNFRV